MILLTISCEKIDPFVETDEGKNVLGFYLDGKKVSYKTSGGFPSEYPYEQCVYTEKLKSLPRVGAIVKTQDGVGEVSTVETLKEILKALENG